MAQVQIVTKKVLWRNDFLYPASNVDLDSDVADCSADPLINTLSVFGGIYL